MERLTSPNINVDPDTDRFLHAAIGGKEFDWKQSRDSTLNVLLNGPTSNGFCKDIFRKMVRDLYGRLKAYEDTGLTPEEVLPKDKADEIALKLMRLADLERLCNYTRLRELAEADKDGRCVVLPCKVYETDGVRVYEHAVRGIIYRTAGGPDFDESTIGKSIFLTREEAERAMEGRKDG